MKKIRVSWKNGRREIKLENDALDPVIVSTESSFGKARLHCGIFGKIINSEGKTFGVDVIFDSSEGKLEIDVPEDIADQLRRFIVENNEHGGK